VRVESTLTGNDPELIVASQWAEAGTSLMVGAGPDLGGADG